MSRHFIFKENKKPFFSNVKTRPISLALMTALGWPKRIWADGVESGRHDLKIVGPTLKTPRSLRCGFPQSRPIDYDDSDADRFRDLGQEKGFVSTPRASVLM